MMIICPLLVLFLLMSYELLTREYIMYSIIHYICFLYVCCFRFNSFQPSNCSNMFFMMYITILIACMITRVQRYYVSEVFLKKY